MYDLAMIDGVVGQSDQRRSGRLGSPVRPTTFLFLLFILHLYFRLTHDDAFTVDMFLMIRNIFYFINMTIIYIVDYGIYFIYKTSCCNL